MRIWKSAGIFGAYDETDSLVLIDMMNVCKGPALYDIARTYFLLKYDTNIQNEYLMRMECALEDIMPYLDVILAIRENEMKSDFKVFNVVLDILIDVCKSRTTGARNGEVYGKE